MPRSEALPRRSAPRCPGAPRAIRILLSAASLLFLLLVIGLGAFSMQRLSDVNRVSDEIRNQWLQDIRLIGDLNNYMSDYRTGEGTHLLSNTRGGVDRERKGDRCSSTRKSRARNAPTRPGRTKIRSSGFTMNSRANGRPTKPSRHKCSALSHSGVKAEAVSMYMTTSRQAFDRASDTLGRLTDQTVSKARQASERAAGAYLHDSRLIVTAMIVAACLVLATIIYITRSVSRPLLNLARRMHALASHDTNISIPGTRRDDEIGEMARSVAVFRDNAIALVQSQRRLIEQAAALETTLEKERRATAQQRNFVTMTSHEFRTPLTVIDAQAQRLIKLKERLTPNDLLERALRIRSAVTRLTGIMDSLLGDSLLLDGQAVYRPSDFVPAELLHEVCQLHRETTRNADIREDFAELPSVMLGDRKLLFALFSNLLSNALKYSAPGDPIEVRAYRDTSEKISVCIRDRGLGISERDRAHLFERYFRGANAVGVAGSGVGLHLVAMVLELHGGTIEVESTEGVGSTFVVHLPATAAAAMPPDEIHQDEIHQ